MLSIEMLRHDPDAIRNALRRRREDAAIVDRLLGMDSRRRALVSEADGLRSRRNTVSKEIGQLHARKQGAEALIEEMRALGDRIKDLEEQTRQADTQLQDLLLSVPNIPRPDVPDGDGAEQNIVTRSWGTPRKLDFPAQAHWDLGEKLGIVDMEAGARLSGARFYVLRGLGARLERALIAFFLKVHTQEHGYVEIAPPYLVRREVLVGSGNLPKFGDNLYHDAEDDLWLVPTAEVPLTSLHRDQIIEGAALPIRYVAYTPCFRKERTAAGRDVRGIKRVHQFDKVEMYQFVAPDQSDAAQEQMAAHAETLLRRLDLPYRVLKLCTGDIGFPSARTYDLEVWAPGCQEWLEVSSISTCTDFQARRANIRFRPRPGASTEFVHTLNGSGLALPRVVIAVLENYQQPDGSVVVPEVLRGFMGVERLAPPGG